MLKVSVDEGHAFDMLSILEVKHCKICEGSREPKYFTEEECKKSESLLSSFKKLMREISEQIGEETLNKVMSSNEYRELKEANERTFDLVNKIRNGEDSLAKQADTANLERFEAKASIQNKFFDKKITEIKL